MSNFTRQLGHLAGGAAQGLQSGMAMKNRKDLTEDSLKTNADFRAFMQAAAKKIASMGAPGIASMFSGSAAGQAPAAMGSGEDNVMDRTAAPPTSFNQQLATPMAASPLANSMAAPPEPTQMFTQQPRRLPFTDQEG